MCEVETSELIIYDVATNHHDEGGPSSEYRQGGSTRTTSDQSHLEAGNQGHQQLYNVHRVVIYRKHFGEFS